MGVPAIGVSCSIWRMVLQGLYGLQKGRRLHLGKLAGTPVGLCFVMKDADLSAIRFGS